MLTWPPGHAPHAAWVIVGHCFCMAHVDPHVHVAGMMWVIVGYAFCVAHNDSRGKGTNFPFSVCGSCGSLFTPLFSRAKYGALHEPYNTQSNLWF